VTTAAYQPEGEVDEGEDGSFPKISFIYLLTGIKVF